MESFKNLMALFLLMAAPVAICQDYKTEIRSDFTAYLDALTKKQFEKSTAYLVPGLFEIIPKAQMIKAMEQAFNNPDMEFELKDSRILSVNDSKLIQQKYYAMMTYSNMMNMRFKAEKGETVQDKKDRIEMLRESMAQTFGEKNVTYNSATDYFEIYSEKEVYAISDNGKTEWKFLVLEKNQKALLEKLLPAELVH